MSIKGANQELLNSFTEQPFGVLRSTANGMGWGLELEAEEEVGDLSEYKMSHLRP